MTDESKQAQVARNAALEQAASIWDGCIYQSVGEDIDIGAAIRALKDAPAIAVKAEAVPAENARLREALQFYADGHHFYRHDPSVWDTVSGEPANFFEDEANTATVEDGSIAKMALAAPPAESAQPAAITAGDAECRFVVWWAHNRSKFTTARQAARAAMLDAILPAAPQAAQAAPVDADALDATRYRKLRAQAWHSSDLFVVAGGKECIKLGVDCPSLDRLDAAVDALTASKQEDAV